MEFRTRIHILILILFNLTGLLLIHISLDDAFSPDDITAGIMVPRYKTSIWNPNQFLYSSTMLILVVVDLISLLFTFKKELLKE